MGAILLGSAAGSHAANTPEQALLFGHARFEGAGCHGAWGEVIHDRLTGLDFLFVHFQNLETTTAAKRYRGNHRIAGTTCEVEIPLDLDAGQRLWIRPIIMRSKVSLPEGSEAWLNYGAMEKTISRKVFAGKTPVKGLILVNEKLPNDLHTACGTAGRERSSLEVDASISIDSGSSADASAKTAVVQFAIGLESCR